MKWMISKIPPSKNFIRRWLLRLGVASETTSLLDYHRIPIQLIVSSEIESGTRLHSCQKEPEVIQWIEEEFQPEDVFYDIGANIGAYTLVAAAYWKGSIQVISFEPSGINYGRLLSNLRLNGLTERVIALPVALSDQTRLDTFHYQNTLAGGALHALGNATDSQGNPFDPSFSTDVLAFTLDDLIEQFHLPAPTQIKLDVDGIENRILNGGRKTLFNVKSLMVEIDGENPHATGIRSFLKECGFCETAVYPYRYGKTQPQFQSVSNVLFKRTVTDQPVTPLPKRSR